MEGEEEGAAGTYLERLSLNVELEQLTSAKLTCPAAKLSGTVMVHARTVPAPQLQAGSDAEALHCRSGSPIVSAVANVAYL